METVSQGHLELVLFPVDDDSRNLLVHEDQDRCQQSWDDASDGRPPRVLPEWTDHPATVWIGGLVTLDSEGQGQCDLMVVKVIYIMLKRSRTQNIRKCDREIHVKIMRDHEGLRQGREGGNGRIICEGDLTGSDTGREEGNGRKKKYNVKEEFRG